ncbi:MAG: beta-glucosidase, partial [Deltaproteobacteria bacterium]|nr:beta-glucosidase [Deltaproteobacteria bacterium]
MRHLSLVFALASLLFACSGTSSTGGSDLENRVDELIEQMTLEEKVAQMAGDGEGFFLGDETAWNVPGVERLGIPPFRMADGPRGVTTVEGATTFPVGVARGA